MSKSGYEVWCRICGCLMRLRKGKYGEFFGCSGYPKCFNTLSIRDASLQEGVDNFNHEDYPDYKDDPSKDND